MGLADGAPGGRPVAPVQLIKSGNQPLSYCRERESIKDIHFVHPGQRSNCAPWFENLATRSQPLPLAITHEPFQPAMKLINIV